MTSIAPVKTPWHLWVVGGLTLLWNAFGAVDYVMTQTKNPQYMAAFSDEEKNYFYNMPIGYEIVWAIGIWFAVLGSILLLLRMKLAVSVILISLAAFIASCVYGYVIYVAPFSNMSMYLFSAVIFVVLVLTLIYARAMSKRGVLR